MKLYGVINNRDLELSMVRALARAGVTTEHVNSAEDADVLVIFDKGHGFGVALDEVRDVLALAKPKAVVAMDGWEGGELTAVVRPHLVNRKLKVKMSDVVEAVLNVAPPDFEIEDDTESVEFVDDVVGREPTLQDRLARVLAPARAARTVALAGCKGGVGTTTLAACLTQALSGLGAVHVEPAGTGGVYYGDGGGAYARSCPEGTRVAVLDGEARGDVSIAVTDDSLTSFNCLRHRLAGGGVPDIVVVNRMRGGIIESVFRTEFPQVSCFFTVVENYKACIDAQEAGKVPTLLGPDLAGDVGKLAARVREMLDLS